MSNSSPTPSILPAATATEDQHTLQQIELLRCLLVTVQHFFGGFNQLFRNVFDPRHPAFITYPLPSVLTAGVLMFLLRLGARRQVNLMLRMNGPSSIRFEALFCIETCPHGDTLDETCSRLPICLLLDGLSAGGPTFSICEKYGWKYLIVLQENDLPSVQEQFNGLLDAFPENHLRFRPADQYKTTQDFDWVNDIEYIPDAYGVLKTTRFKWMTNFTVKMILDQLTSRPEQPPHAWSTNTPLYLLALNA